MKLWFLYRESSDYDEMSSLVVRAKDEKSARIIASINSIDEGEQVWLDSSKSKCNKLICTGKPGIIIRDVNWG
jgi:hypothetical protein